MNLVRNEQDKGKYAVIKLDTIDPNNEAVMAAIKVLEENGIINYGPKNTDKEFFVIMLKDINSNCALEEYALGASAIDSQYACEVMDLSKRAGVNSPFCKVPD